MLERAPYVLSDSRLLVQRYLQLSEEVGREPDEDILQRMHAVLASAGIHTPEGKTTRSSNAPAEEVIRDAPAGTPSCATWVRRCAGSRRTRYAVSGVLYRRCFCTWSSFERRSSLGVS